MTDRSRFIRDHAVCWEIGPLFEIKASHFQQVGFDLRLHAQAPLADPGTAEARETYATLHEMVLEALPPGSEVEIEPYDATVHFRRETGWAAEIDLRAAIRHPDQTFEPVDDSERAQARAITSSLRKLGIPEGVSRRSAA